jgi:opacity protein-like surface antigen
MRRIAILFAFLPFLLGSSAVAQPEVSVRGDAGAAFFQSPEGLNTVLNPGTNLGLGASIHMTRGLELVLEGSYDRFTFNGDTFGVLDDDLSVGSEVKGGDLSLQNATVGLRYTLKNQSDAHPYVAGGVGVYRSVLERTTIPESDDTFPRRTATTSGYHVSVGSEFLINETYSFFFEPRLVIVDTEETDLRTQTSTRYVTVLMGVDVQF